MILIRFDSIRVCCDSDSNPGTFLSRVALWNK